MDVVGGINYRYKWMRKLFLDKLLNPELIYESSNFCKFVQVHETE